MDWFLYDIGLRHERIKAWNGTTNNFLTEITFNEQKWGLKKITKIWKVLINCPISNFPVLLVKF